MKRLAFYGILCLCVFFSAIHFTAQAGDGKKEIVPIFSANPQDLTIECGDAIPPPQIITAVGQTGDDLEVTFEEVVTSTDPCNVIYSRIWTATDQGEQPVSIVQNITVVDTTPPIITGPILYEVDCQNTTDVNLTFTDNCDENPTVSFNDFVVGGAGCPNVRIIRSTTVTDFCGNEASFEQIIDLIDTTAPQIFAEPLIEIACGDTPPEDTYSVVEGCSFSTVDVAVVDEVQSCDEAPCDITRTITATDECGNTATFVQTIAFGSGVDVEAPSVEPLQDLFLECDEMPQWDAPVVSDNCDEEPSVQMVETESGSECNFTITRTYTVSDIAGNTTIVAQTANFTDTQTPFFVVLPEDMVLSCEETLPDFNIVAEDDCATDVQIDQEVEVIVNDCGFEEIYTWTASDGCGNTVSATRTMIFVDNTAPEILSGLGNLSLGCTDEIPLPNITVVDNCDPDPTFVSVDTYVPGTSCPEIYIRTITLSDQCGNAQSFEVQISVSDVTPPVLLSTISDQTISCEEAVVFNTPIVTDDCSVGILESSFMDEQSTQDCSTAYTRTWMYSDVCGNTLQFSQTITTVDDTPPVLQNILADQTISCEAPVLFGTPVVTDNCSTEDLNVSFSDEINAQGCSTTHTRTWMYSDDCGNTTQFSQTITALDDVPPTISNLPTIDFLACGETLEANPTASDACSDEVTLTFQDSQGSFFNCVAQNTRTYTATDGCDNTTTQSITYDVGSCFPSGCTNPDADNYNPIACFDNGSCSFACAADLNEDGEVGINDLLVVTSFLGCTADCVVDFDQNGSTGVTDLLFIVSNLGGICE